MFLEPELSPLTQHTSSSNLQEESESHARSTPRKEKVRKVREEVIEVETGMLPGSDLGHNFAKRREAQEANKENENENERNPDKETKTNMEKESTKDDNNEDTGSLLVDLPSRRSQKGPSPTNS
jgi:hypothetical protein